LATSKKNAGLLKAVGLDKARESLRIVDTTAGLGIDAFILAAMGCKVTLLEKSPVMAALLADGLRRGMACGDNSVIAAVSRMTLIHIDAHEFLRQLTISDCPDVITLDPMYPARQKTAKVKKDMALMQTMLPPNEDVDALLSAARAKAQHRVVLKRPGKLTKDADGKPDFQVPGKTSHFQVFLTL
jgi:16S rRNA (guanine1516-N2)-methyltransferase